MNLVRVPINLIIILEPNVCQGSVFLRGWRGLFKDGIGKGVLFKNFGPLSQRLSTLATKLLTKELLESCTFLFSFVPGMLAHEATQTARCESDTAFVCCFS